MLDEFPHAQQFARVAEGFLRGVEGRDGGERAVCAVQVPCEEAREVLDGAEEFVAADCWGLVH